MLFSTCFERGSIPGLSCIVSSLIETWKQSLYEEESKGNDYGGCKRELGGDCEEMGQT